MALWKSSFSPLGFRQDSRPNDLMNCEATPTRRELLTAASPPHSRVGWAGEGCAQILVNDRLSILRGTEQGLRLKKAKMAALYERAKTENDMDAAHQIVEVMWHKPVYEDLLAKVLLSGVRPIIVSPHPAFDDDDVIDHDVPFRASPRNAIPFAYAAKLRIMLNGIENTEIKQGARVGRTKLNRFPKFLFQPHFVGEVDPERPYILVDDNVGLGGTMAALYSHIARHGGTVLGVATLAHSTGRNVPFALTEATLLGLYSKYGHEVCALWKEKVGHEAVCLTEGEAGFLLDWQSGAEGDGCSAEQKLHALRTRLDRARATFK